MDGHRRLSTTQTEKCHLIEMNHDKFLFAVRKPDVAIELLASVDERPAISKSPLSSVQVFRVETTTA